MNAHQLLACAFIATGVIVGYLIGWYGAKQAAARAVPRHHHDYDQWTPGVQNMWRDGKITGHIAIQSRKCKTCGWIQREQATA